MIQEKDMHATRPMGDNFFHILSILIIFRCNFSLATYVPQYSSIIQLGLFGIWYAIAVFRHKDMFQYTLKICWPLIVFLCINMTIDDVFMGGWTTITKNYILILMIFLIYLSYSFENDSKYKKIMIAMIILEFVYIGFNTMKELASNPLYSRMLASSTDDLEFRGVAGYGHIYAYMISICAFISLMFCKQTKKTHKTGLILLVTFGVVLLFDAKYMIAITIVFGQIFYCLLFKNSYKSPVKAIITIAVITLLAILSANIFDLIYHSLDSEIFKEKLDDLSAFFSGRDANQTDGRIKLMKLSLETFFDNFFWGIYGTKEGGRIGHHSGAFDLLAQFGAFRGGLFITFMCFAYRYILNRFNDAEYKSTIKNIFIIMVIFTIIDPFVFQQFFVSLFITVPFMAELMLVRDNNH